MEKILSVQLSLKTSVQENTVGKNYYTRKRYNACLPPIHSDLQWQVGSWFACLVALDLGY